MLLLWRGEDDDSESLSGLSSMDRTEERAGSDEHSRPGGVLQEVVG